MNIAFVGCGAFAKDWVPLFGLHPDISRIFVCDLIREKAEDFSRRFQAETIDTYEHVLDDSRVDAVMNFTPRHLHGDIVIRALEHGKHVFSAVPMASEPEECRRITELVRKTGKIYMMAETCYYYPCAMLARELYESGRMGTFQYGASQYYHHINAISYGRRPGEGGMTPLLYPTHSTAMLLSAVHSYAKKVVCLGHKADPEYRDRFSAGHNYWDNEFSNQHMMLELENGGIARITEARTFGWKSPSSFISACYGSRGGYEFSINRHTFVERIEENGTERAKLTDFSDYANPAEMTKNRGLPDWMERAANGQWQQRDPAPIQYHEISRLPEPLQHTRSGHMYSHPLLADDFCRAVRTGIHPAMNAWTAARYTVPGLIGIRSALAGGMPQDIPDYGTCPFPVAKEV